jgi:hypothetical protein
MRPSVPLALGSAGVLLLAACADPSRPTAALDDVTPSLDRSNRGTAVLHIASRTPEVLATVQTATGPVLVNKSGYGSGMTMAPGSVRDFFLLTDRGPNYDGPGTAGAANLAPKRFPDPTYAPRIYRAHMSGSQLRFDREIVLTRPDGVTPLTGLPIPAGQCGSTLEVAQTVDGTELPPDEFGLDAEGIVALRDGTFWVSDEYGPFIAHYDANGRELQRLSPCNGGLPEVYKLRRPNRGMEGLAVTPDGRWLVGIMQAPLENPAPAGVRNISRATRVLFRHLRTGETREYLYLLERANLQGNSEMLALSDTRFLVIERDGGFLTNPAIGAATLKHIYEFDIAGATEIGALGRLGATPIGGTKTLEQATVAELEAAGIRPVRKTLRVDLLALGYPHDKPEGLALAPGGMLFVVNDDDFSIFQVGGQLVQKRLAPAGAVDVPTVWQIRLP